MQLKFYSLVKDLQPQTAAFLAATGAGRSVIPASGDSVLTVDLGTSLAVERVLDQLLKDDSLSAASGLAIERQGSAFEFISARASEVEAVAKQLLKLAGLKTPAKTAINQPPTLGAVEVIEQLAPLHATLINRARRGAMVAAGDALLMAECQPATLVSKLANQLEQECPDVLLVDMDSRTGRLVLTGPLATLRKIQQKSVAG